MSSVNVDTNQYRKIELSVEDREVLNQEIRSRYNEIFENMKIQIVQAAPEDFEQIFDQLCKDAADRLAPVFAQSYLDFLELDQFKQERLARKFSEGGEPGLINKAIYSAMLKYQDVIESAKESGQPVGEFSNDLHSTVRAVGNELAAQVVSTFIIGGDVTIDIGDETAALTNQIERINDNSPIGLDLAYKIFKDEFAHDATQEINGKSYEIFRPGDEAVMENITLTDQEVGLLAESGVIDKWYGLSFLYSTVQKDKKQIDNKVAESVARSNHITWMASQLTRAIYGVLTNQPKEASRGDIADKSRGKLINTYDQMKLQVYATAYDAISQYNAEKSFGLTESRIHQLALLCTAIEVFKDFRDPYVAATDLDTIASPDTVAQLSEDGKLKELHANTYQQIVAA